MPRSRYYLLFIGLICLSACNEHYDTSKVVFRYNQPFTVTSLDPAFARNQSNIWAVDHLYNTLIQLDDSLKPKPCLAKSWEIDKSGTLITLHLRTDVMFHDDACFEGKVGRKMVASDVIFSFNRILDPTVNSPGSWVFKGRVQEKNPFMRVDDSTVQIQLKAPFMPFIQILSMQYCSVVPHEAIEKYGADFRAHPVGTGPFSLVKWIEGQTMILTRNSHYFEIQGSTRLPYVDGVRIEFIGDKKSAFLELLQGKLDFVSGFDPGMSYELFTQQGRLRERYQDRINYFTTPYLNTEYLGFNLDLAAKDPYLSKKAFRQALNYGFDRIAMLQTIRRGIGTPALASFVPYGLPSFDTAAVHGYRYDPALAKQLLRSTGYLDLPFDRRPVLQLFTSKDYSDFGLFILRQWEALGIRASIELAEPATTREMMRNGTALFFRGSWMADYPEAENYLTVFYGKNDAPPIYTRFKNNTYDKLYDQALAEKNEQLRFKLYHEMEQIIVDEAPVIFLFYDAVSVFTSKSIYDYQPNALNVLKVKYIKKKRDLK